MDPFIHQSSVMHSIFPIEFNIDKNSKVLIVYPHPDDEAFSTGCFIMRLVKAKISLKVVCLTKGEASTLKNGVGDNQLSEVRACEFETVMIHLGVTNFEIRDFPDKALEVTPELNDFLQLSIDAYRPTHVVTYEPCGIYGHPDHIYVSKLLTDLSKRNTYKLIYSTVSEDFFVPQEALAMAHDPKSIKPLAPNSTIKLSPLEFIRKLKAISLYKSQMQPNTNILSTLKYLPMFFKEYYFTT